MNYNDITLALNVKFNDKFKILKPISILVIVLLCAGTTLGFRMVELGPFVIPGSTTLYPITYFVYSLVTEVYGYQETRKLIWMAIFFNFLFSILVYQGNHLPAPTYWNEKAAYDLVYGNILFFTSAGSLGMATSEFLNSYIVAKWKVILKGRLFLSSFSFRALIASFIGEAVHVLIFASVVCYFTVPKEHWLMTLLYTYIYRIFYGIIAIVPASICVYYLKKYEGMDPYDDDINFNPFQLND